MNDTTRGRGAISSKLRASKTLIHCACARLEGAGAGGWGWRRVCGGWGYEGRKICIILVVEKIEISSAMLVATQWEVSLISSEFSLSVSLLFSTPSLSEKT